jgi:hypothetical protein
VGPGPTTIGAPPNRSSTTARSVVVRGTAPVAPKGIESLVTATVNGRRFFFPAGADRRPKGAAYRRDVTLDLGVNTVSATTEFFADAGSGVGPCATIAITRTPGRGTGTLDRATAYLVTEFSDAAYCGEEGCGAQWRCFVVGPHRVDCPIGFITDSDPVYRCVDVMTVRLRRRAVYYGTYGCPYRRLYPTPRRFVRRAVHRHGRRLTFRGADNESLRDEAIDPNRYGVPRIDASRDEFVP